METQRSALLYTQLCRQFSLDEILSATQNFNDALVVGEGGFGKVYKGTINVENGATVIVAIKRLDSGSNQGAPEFRAEIETLTKLRHCNLVSLIGYCNDNSEMILIYEFMPHGTLQGHLHRYGTSMSWLQRLKISIGAARGLHYLHTGTGTQQGVIHRDVKSSNILLDKDYAAKISDFGLSKIGLTNNSGAYVNTLVRGTFGYLDPEYFLSGRLTLKSDVFAFGVVLFELLCGRAAVDKRLDDNKCSLAKWAHESIEKGKSYEIIDLNIKSQISPKCLKLFVQTADRCLSSESRKRPTMAEVLIALELSLKLQNKFDIRVNSAAGISTFARMIKWPFISSEVNSVQNDGNLSTINEEHTSSSKGDSVVHGEVFTLKESVDHLNHVPASTNSPDKDNINHASLLEECSNHYELKNFSFNDLKMASRNFKQRIGGGEFGVVYEGWMNINAFFLSPAVGLLRIAIKRFHHGSKIQYNLKEKLVDMTFLSELNHPNLVKVLGYCSEGEKQFLVYEFMENGSLDSHLFTKDKMPLSLKRRLQIALGIAEALLFLKETPNQADYMFSIKIHQILLDKNFNAKISDFEYEKLVYGDSCRGKGIDPLYYYEYYPGMNFEFEGIIRSFGVVLLQILTGRREIDIAKLKQERLRRALDPLLLNLSDTALKAAAKLVRLAVRCCVHRTTLETALAELKNTLKRI